MNAPERRLEGRSLAELEAEVHAGRLTQQQLDEVIQARARREAAERSKVHFGRERHLVEGFGSGQGMGSERSGNEPGVPDEEGLPRDADQEWPH